MGQRRFGAAGGILLIATIALASCDDASVRAPAPIPASAPASNRSSLKIASLVPAATDLLIAMGAGDQLVAVSTFDVDREGVHGLPRVGDYQTIDWEQIGALRPDVMIVSQKPDRMPAGVKQRADALGVRLFNVKVDDLNDIFVRLKELGDACGIPDKADSLAKKMHTQLAAVQARVASREKVTALLTLEEAGLSIAGPGSYLDDLLTIAGGRNAAAGLNNPYPSIDREMLRSLDPQVIIQLLPNASPQVLEKAKQYWAAEKDLRAVRDGRVVTITDWYCLLPGAHTPDVAEKIAAALHPSTTQPATQTSP